MRALALNGEPPRGVRPLKTTEHDEQVAVFQWAALQEARYPALKLMFAVPNGGLRSKGVAGKLKAEGVKPGVPDICLPYPTFGTIPRHGLFIEMKVPPNRPTRVQNGWLHELASVGYTTRVCYDAAEAITAIECYLGIPVSRESGRRHI